MADLKVNEVGGEIVIMVKVVPGSSKTAISGWLEGMVKIKVAAPPEKGKANECLVEFLANKLKVRRNSISIISGASSPVKQVRISGITKEEFLAKVV
jgi:uncharacterized protein (TIGR00251 family)